MSPISSLLNDTVYIENQNGNRTGPYKSAIGTQNGLSASIFQTSLNVEEGCKLVRMLPNGKEERYTVLEVNYSPGLSSIPPNWKLKLSKDSSLVQHRKEPTTTINISNSQGIQIGDHNIQNITNSIASLIEMIESSAIEPMQKEEARGLLQKLLANPAVAAVLGGATSGLLGLLK